MPDEKGTPDNALVTMLQTVLLRQDAFQKDAHDQGKLVTELGHELRETIKEIERVSTVIRGAGNGKDGLSPRIDRLEEKVAGVAVVLDDFRGAFDARVAASETGKWDLAKGMAIALISGVFLLLGALVSGLLKIGKGP